MKKRLYIYILSFIILLCVLSSVSAWTVDLLLPIDGYNSSSNDITFKFNTSADAPAASNSTLWTNFSGTWQANETNTSSLAAGENGTIYVENITDGTYIWNINTTNQSDYNLSAVNYTLTIDTTQPNVSAFNNPSNLSNISGSFIINATVTDLTTDVKSVYFNITNGSSFVILNAENSLNDFWNASINSSILEDGSHNITVYANDTVGNWNRDEFINITIDNTPPNVAAFNGIVVEGANLSSGIQIINATINDTTLDVNTVYFKIINSSSYNFANITASNSAGDFWNASFDVSAYSEGTYDIIVYANDTLGNLNSSEIISIKIDRTAPAGSSESPANHTFVNSVTNINVTLVINDTLTKVNTSSIQFTIGGFPYAPNTTSASTNGVTTSYLMAGPYSHGYNVSISADAKDFADNSMPSYHWYFAIDTIEPSVADININDTDRKVRTSDMLNITLNATNSAAGIDNVSVSNGSTVNYLTQISSDIWQIVASGNTLGCAADGNCTLTFNATDNAGNKNNSEKLNITIDNTNPLVSHITTNDADNKVRSTDSIQINVTVNDTNFDTGSTVIVGNLSTVSMTKQSTSNDSSIWSSTTTASALGCNATNGNCILTFTATDIVKNINSSETLTITVDDTPPSVLYQNTNDTNNIVRNNTYLNFTVNVTDTNTVKNVTLNGTSLNLSGGDIWSTVNYTYQLCPGLTNGACTLTFTSYDNVSNLNNSETLTIYVDHTNPAFVNVDTSDSDNIVTSTDSINFTANVTDTYNVSGVSLNNTPMTQITNSTVWNTTNTTAQFGCASDGSCTLLFTATDNAGNINNQTLTITVDNTPPTYNNLTRSPATIYNTLNVTVSAVWNDTNGVSTVVFEHNASESFVNYTATNSNGNYSLLINSSSLHNQEVVAWRAHATDNAGKTNSSMPYQTFTVTNRILYSSTIPAINWSQNSNITLNLSAYFSDYDSDNLTYLATTSPQNITIIINNNTKTATFVPDTDFNYKYNGIRNVTFNATDSYSWNNSNMVMLNVTYVNTYSPVVSTIPDITFNEDSHNDTINLSDYVYDKDNYDNEINWTVLGNNSITVTVDQTTKKINVSAGTNFYGSEAIVFMANDGAHQIASNAVTVTVMAVNDAPTTPTPIYPANDSSVTTTSITLNWTGSTDPEGNNITYYVFLSNTTSGLFNNTNATTSANYTNAAGLIKGETYYWALVAGDGTANSSNSSIFQFNASFNNPPTFTGTIQNLTWPEDISNSSVNLSAYFSDNDAGDALTYSSTTPNNLTVSISSAGIVNLTPNTNFVGINYINFSASDGTNTTLSNQVKLNVTNVNDTPVLTAIGAQTAPQGSVFSYDTNATDADSGDTLTFSDNSTLFTINSSSGEFSFTPTNAQVGAYKINISVSDAAGLSDSEIFTLTISNTNDAPVLDSISSKAAAEDSQLKFNITASDLDNNSLTFTSNITSITFTNAANNSLATASWTPTNSNVGNNTANITASDGTLTDSQLVTITVTNTNDAPSITAYYPANLNPRISADTGTQLFNITASDPDTGDALNKTWFKDNTWVATGTSYTASSLSAGSYNITAKVNDTSGNATQQEWLLNATTNIVSNLYSGSILDHNTTEENASDISVNESAYGSIGFLATVNLSNATNIDDYLNISKGVVSIDKNILKGFNRSASIIMKGLNYTKTPLIYYNSGFNVIAGGTICNPSTTPSCTNIIYDSTNGILKFDVEHFSTYYSGTNTTNGAPEITSTPKVNATAREAYSYDVDAADPDGDTLTYSLTLSPSGMSISSSTGSISWTPTNSQVGMHNIIVRVSDSNLTDNQTFNISVAEAKKLRIKNLDVKVDGKSDRGVTDEDTISREAEPESEIEFKVEVESGFEDEDDIKIEDIIVEITIKDIDDGDDIDEESNEFDLRPERDKKVTIDFKVPLEVDEDTYDVDIHVEGEDENGTMYEVDWTVYLEVEKDKHNIKIIKASLNPAVIICEKTATLKTEIINLGREDEDEVVLEITSPDLINFRKESIELEEGTDSNRYSKSLSIAVPDDLEVGTYPIEINTYYDTTHLSDTETITLEIQECKKVVKKEEDVKAEPAVVVKETKPEVKPKEEVTKITFRESTGYTVFLALSFVILSGLLVFVIGLAIVLLKKK